MKPIEPGGSGEDANIEALLPVLQRAWEAPFTTRSNFARDHTDEIAQAACMGLLTIRNIRNTWGRSWRITSAGLHLLENTPCTP